MAIDKISKKAINRTFLLTVIASLVVYVVLRALQLSFTHDECLTYKIILGDKGLAGTANNHFLNTWLTGVFYKIFGTQELILRMPNVLAFVLYSYFTYKILIEYNNLVLTILGSSLLLFNPYLFDFFALSRGYGLSLAFGLGALYFLLQNDNVDTPKQFITNLTLSLFFSVLSVYSSLILINLNVALIIVFSIELYFLIKNRIIQIGAKDKLLLVVVFILNGISLIFPIDQLLALENNNQLYFGGKENFIDNTLTLLIHRSIYFSHYDELVWISIRQIILVVFGIVLIYQICNKAYTQLSKITLILVLMIYASILQHYLFDTLYPVQRTSLIFIPLFSVFLIAFIRNLYSLLDDKLLAKGTANLIILLLVCLPLFFHFFSNLNLKYVKDWQHDANTKLVMKEIAEQHKKCNDNTRKITISNDWVLEPSINFYKMLYSMHYLEPANRDGASKVTDYTYCSIEEKEKLTINDSIVILKYFEDIETVLFKRSVNCN